VFGILHGPAGAEQSRVGVLVCPPFGWDELCTHRTIRLWAQLCAAAGHPTLRIDFPGSGDSAGSPRDPKRLEAWTASATAGARLLRERENCQRVVAMGIGLGGMVACRALAEGAPIDDLILWSVARSGSLLLRELRAFASIVAGDGTAPDNGVIAADPDDGSLMVAGFVITAETLAELEALDLTKLPIGDGDKRRVLLLGRDTLAPDRRLREHLEGSGATVTVGDGSGYGAMMVDPQLAEIPDVAFGEMLAWLADTPPPTAEEPSQLEGDPVDVVEGVELREGSARIRESPFEFVHREQRLRGVLTEPVSVPAAAMTAVVFNAGSVRRVGPNRMWVETARRWAALGVPVLRFDLIGLGDSDGDTRRYVLNTDFYSEASSDQVLAALDALEARAMPGTFVVCGVCTGAYWSFHAALSDPRIRSLLLVNLIAFVWGDAVGAARDARRARELLRKGSIGEIIRIVVADRWRIARMVRTRLRWPRPGADTGRTQSPVDDQIASSLDRLRSANVETLLLLGSGEPLLGDLAAAGLIDSIGQRPNLTFERIPLDDHVFRPLWAQRHVAGILDGTLRRAIAVDSGSSPRHAESPPRSVESAGL
jgi:pimeloyl-ACP methyl ester carboxylesterase